MSSILKALKKLENEKTALQPETMKVNREYLSGSSAFGSPTGLILLALLLFAGGSGVTYLILKPSSLEKPQSTKVDVGNPAPSPPLAEVKTVRIAPEVVVPAPGKPIEAQSPSLITVSKPRPLPHSLSKAVVVPASTAKTQPPAVVPHQKQTQEIVEPKLATRMPQQQEEVRKPARDTAPAVTVPLLKVNGIAFQEGGDSVAMINGGQASKGSVIEGARIEGIFRDRVLFSYGAEKIEVMLGKSNR